MCAAEDVWQAIPGVNVSPGKSSTKPHHPQGDGSPCHETAWGCGDVDCIVLGVCHLSPTSAAEARSAVMRHRPSIVCLELCEERRSLLQAPSSEYALLEPLCVNTFREYWNTLLDPVFWVVDLQLMGLEALLDTPLGEEQRAAAAAAQTIGAKVLLVDRQQSITMCRTIAAAANFGALRELFQSLRRSSEMIPSIAREVADLEILILNKDLSAEEFTRASTLARNLVDALLNSPNSATLGPAGAPIQEERDYLLSHSLYHACVQAPPGSRVLAVFGAAHVTGVAQHFSSFEMYGCSATRCGIETQVRQLHEVRWPSVYGALGALMMSSCAGIAGRWAMVRHIRRQYGATWARRFNMGSVVFAAGLGGFGLYRARLQYNAVRGLQLLRREQASSPSSSSPDLSAAAA